MAQLNYGYKTQIGIAGGIADLAPYQIDTYLNEENTGVMHAGLGVVIGTTAGVHAKLPTADSTAADFLGVVTNNRTRECDMEGNIVIQNAKALGVMRYGKIHVRVAEDVEPAFGDAVYMIKSGAQAGCFTNVATGAIAIKAKFVSGVDATMQIATIDLFNQAQA